MKELLIRGTVVYGSTRAFNRAVPYLLLPYLTLYLRPEEFGSLAVFQSSLGIATLFIALSTPSALNRYYFELPTVEIAAWTYGSVGIIVFNTVLVTFLLYLSQDYLVGWLGVSASILLAIPLVALGRCILLLALDRWRHQMMFLRYASLNLAQVIVDVCISLFLVIVASWGAMGRVSGLGLSYLAVGIVGVLLLQRAGQIRFRGEHIEFKRMLSFSLPLIPYALGAWVITSVDRYFLNSILGSAETGIYSIGFLFGSIVVLFQEVVAQAWGPVVFRALSANDAASRNEIVRLYYSLVCIFVLLGLSFSIAVPRLMILFVSESFVGAADVVPWVTWAFVVNSVRAFLVHFIQFSKRNGLLVFTTLVPAPLHIVISYWLISVDGAVGAAKAMLISMTIAALLTFVVVRKSLRLPWLVRE